MAVLTEGKKIGDIIQWERDERYSRQVVTVGASQTIVLGQVLRDSGGSKLALQAAVNEVQTVAIAGTLSAGGFMISFVNALGNIKQTPLIAYNANLAAIQSAVDAALGANKVVVAGTVASFTLTFSGTGMAGTPYAPVVIIADGLTGMTSISVTRTTKGVGAGGDAACIALEKVTTGAGESAEIVALVRDAVVVKDNLTFVTGTEAGAEAALAALGILMVALPTEREVGL